jgi:hypothetical protein
VEGRNTALTGSGLGFVGLGLLLFKSIRSLGGHSFDSLGTALLWTGLGLVVISGVTLVYWTTTAPVGEALPYDSEVPPVNTLALLSLIFAFLPVVPLLPVILGHLALSRIKQTHEAGRGMAMTGLVLGYLDLVGTVLLIILLAN